MQLGEIINWHLLDAAGICLLKTNNKDTRTTGVVLRYGVFIVNFEHITNTGWGPY